MAKKTARPARTLTAFGVVVLLLCGLAALGGTWKPGLGLDLEGGTRITLTADPHYGAPTQQQMTEATNIIDQRVNGSGVSEASVSTQGNQNIVVEIPGRNRRDLVSAVERTAQLRFRLVAQCNGQPCIAGGQTVPTPSASPSSSTSPSPSSSPTPKKKSKAGSAGPVSPSASPHGRVAPAWALSAKKKPKASPLSSPSATPLTPSTPSASTPASTGSAPINQPLKWMDNPTPSWVSKFLSFKCPPRGKPLSPHLDNPSQPLVTCDSSGNKYLLSAAMIEGTQLKSASYGATQQGVGWDVNLSFKSAARQTFADLTTALAGSQKQFAAVLDGSVVSSATVVQPLLDGNAQISGSFTQQQAASLANQLKYGALPVRFAQPPTVEIIGPSLAGSQLSAGLLAVAVGLALVLLYGLLYYRGLGLVVAGSLVVAGVITYSAVLLLSKGAGFTLTLPGIAGLIVAVGITSDSFIVYFERIRDDMRAGRSMRVAVETGWVRARGTCLAADGVSLLAAVVLYIFAIGVVKGFAFALGISTVIDVVVFFFFTKPVMTLVAKRAFFAAGHRHSGLSKESLGIDDPHRRARPVVTGGEA